MSTPTRRQQQAEATRDAILGAARELFAERGYAGTSIEEITARTGAARGALYHHFPSKEALFRAVVEQLEAELMAGMLAAIPLDRGPWEQVEAGCSAFLDACLDRGVRRIFLLDAPAVLTLDQEAWPALLELARAQLRNLFGDDADLDADSVASALLGTLNGLSRGYLAHAEDPAEARRNAQVVLARVLAGLRGG